MGFRGHLDRWVERVMCEDARGWWGGLLLEGKSVICGAVTRPRVANQATYSQLPVQRGTCGSVRHPFMDRHSAAPTLLLPAVSCGSVWPRLPR